MIEYAASLPLLDEDELAAMFSGASGGAHTWTAVHLANVLLNRIRSAELHLVIASDGAPEGLREMVRSIGKQAATGAFTIHVADVHAYRAPGDERLLFVPNVPIETEIVATTMVKVTYEQGTQRPGGSATRPSRESVLHDA